MRPIVNNLKYYNNSSLWHQHGLSSPFDASCNLESEYFLGRSHKIRTSQKTQTVHLNRSYLHGTNSRSKYFDEKDNEMGKSVPKVEIRKRLFNETDSSTHSRDKRADQVVKTPDTKRKRIFSNGRSHSKFERKKDLSVVKDSAMKMKINELFFCQKCYLYLFKMELDYHYPECSSNLNNIKIKSEELRMIGVSKLERLEYALKYTNFRRKQKIIGIIDKIKKNQYYDDGKGNDHNDLLLLEDAEIAVKLIYERFFK